MAAAGLLMPCTESATRACSRFPPPGVGTEASTALLSNSVTVASDGRRCLTPEQDSDVQSLTVESVQKHRRDLLQFHSSRTALASSD